MTDLAERVETAIASVLARGGFTPLHEPRFAGNEWAYVKECIDTGWVSSAGKFVDRFEQDLATYTGAAHAIAVANGTAALHVALQLAGVRAGDEVLVPALTFAATASAVAFCGATPHFVDSEERAISQRKSCPSTARTSSSTGMICDAAEWNSSVARSAGVTRKATT